MGCPNLKYLGLILNVGRWNFVNHFDDITLRLGASKRAARPYAQPPRSECRGEVCVHDPVWGLLWGLLWGPSVKWGYSGQPPNKGEIARVAEAAGPQNFMGIHVSYAALTEIIPAEYVINALANTYIRVKVIREGGWLLRSRSLAAETRIRGYSDSGSLTWRTTLRRRILGRRKPSFSVSKSGRAGNGAGYRLLSGTYRYLWVLWWVLVSYWEGVDDAMLWRGPRLCSIF